eukprot:1159363-Pelagomonas_calceolata.AAC.12
MGAVEGPQTSTHFTLCYSPEAEVAPVRHPGLLGPPACMFVGHTYVSSACSLTPRIHSGHVIWNGAAAQKDELAPLCKHLCGEGLPSHNSSVLSNITAQPMLQEQVSLTRSSNKPASPNQDSARVPPPCQAQHALHCPCFAR